MLLCTHLAIFPTVVKEGASGPAGVGGFVRFTDVVWHVIRSRVREGLCSIKQSRKQDVGCG